MTKRIGFSALISISATLLSGSLGHAHNDGRVYPIPEITDQQFSQIEIDGLIHEWEEFGEPTMNIITDFRAVGYPNWYDIANLDFQIWIGWHDATNRIYLAYIGTDDIFFRPFEYGPERSMDFEDSVHFLIDADHSGEPGVTPNSDNWLEWEEVYGRTQNFDATALAVGGPNIDALVIRGGRDWELPFQCFPPFGDAAGSVYGENPTIVTIEMYFTPFDGWQNGAQSNPEEIDFSELHAGHVIGFSINVIDIDRFRGDATWVWVPNEISDDPPDPDTLMSFLWADKILDGLLLSAEPNDTSIATDSWARIKASLK